MNKYTHIKCSNPLVRKRDHLALMHLTPIDDSPEESVVEEDPNVEPAQPTQNVSPPPPSYYQ